MLNLIATNYLEKEAAGGVGLALTAASRFAPKVFGLLNKVKFLQPAMAGMRGGFKKAGRYIGSKSTFGKGFVEGLRGATTDKGRIVSKIAKNMPAVPGSNISLNNKAINKLWLGRNLGHFANVNTWSPYNKGLMVDGILYAGLGNMLFGGGNKGGTAMAYNGPVVSNAAWDSYLNGQYYGDPRNYDQYF
jgi:hypothetical protein